MSRPFFANIFAELPLPVLVCTCQDELPVVYANVQSGLMFYPEKAVEGLTRTPVWGNLDDILHFPSPQEYASFKNLLIGHGQLNGYACLATTSDNTQIPVLVFGNRITHENSSYYTLILQKTDQAAHGQNLNARLSFIISATILDPDTDSAINTVLALAGKQVNASRVYIFEEISSTMTRNTYEWCAEGVPPAIQDLQNLPKAEYPYDTIIENGMFIADDIRTIDDENRAVLEPQGIKSLALVPILDHDVPLGYVGFDDTEHYRQWSQDEIHFLKSISLFLASMMKRRNTEQHLLNSRRVMQLITDNSEDTIYTSSLEDHSLLFVSNSLARSVGTTPQALLGKKCWELFHPQQTGPCDHCPIPYLKLKPGQDRSNIYMWENLNERNGKTYLAKDNLLRWVDGTTVHMQVGTDITDRIAYEEKLRYFASTDAMTGVSNREWGTLMLEEKLDDPSAAGSLIFLDVDGLKKVNDQLGHAAGDELLGDVVQIIRENLAPNDFICRWGGDEFLVWTSYSPPEAEAWIADIYREMATFNREEERPYELAFSHGIVAFLPEEGPSLDMLVTAADRLMYDNKTAKRIHARNRRREDN